jgi:type IV secretory pathway VirB10-like protein
VDAADHAKRPLEERQQGADAGGYSGLEDEVHNHWAELLRAALLFN